MAFSCSVATFDIMDKRHSNDGKKRHHSGRKWYFSKKENGEVLTLHQASRSPVLSQDGTEPGYVVNLKPSSQDFRKLKVWAVSFFTFKNVGQNYDVFRKLISLNYSAKLQNGMTRPTPLHKYPDVY